MSNENFGPVPPDGSIPPSPPPSSGYPPASDSPPPAQSYGTPPPVPGYGESGPAQPPTPGYGQVPPAYPPAASYPSVPVTPAQYNAGGMGGPTLAQFSDRAKSAVIDWLPQIVLSSIAGAIGNSVITSLVSLINLAWVIYNMGYLAGTTGQTYGRKWAGTRLVREDTMQPLGVGLAIGRLFAHFIDAVICYVGFLFPLWTPKKQTIADMIVKSVVVVDPR